MPRQQIVIASKNENKVREIGQILDNININIISLNAFPEISDVEETGESFLANARLKAEYYHQKLDRPVISDDSGLVVPALNGEPGVYSARYAGTHADYQANNQKLLRKMNQLDGDQRNAYFICVVVYLDSETEILGEGRVYGQISRTPAGSSGFGYDPLFYHPESKMTFAQMSPDLKNSLSHRYLALQELKNKLDHHWHI